MKVPDLSNEPPRDSSTFQCSLFSTMFLMAFYGLLRISGFCLDMANSFSILRLEVVVCWSTFFATLTTFQFSVRQFNVTLQLAVFFKIGVMETLALGPIFYVLRPQKGTLLQRKR